MDQKKIIQAVMGFWPVEGQRCLNTLRGDTKPNCHFKWQSGYLRLHDYGRDLYHKRNCFDLVSIKINGRPIMGRPDLDDALGWIKSNVGETGQLIQRFPEEFKFTLNVEQKPIPKAGLEYWGEYGITVTQLIEDGVTGVEQYDFNTEDAPRVKMICYPEDVAFCYWYKSGHKKVYRPNQSEPYKKWRTDCIQTDVHFDNGVKCDEIFILGSYKDTRVCRNAGFEAKGLQSESAWPGENIIRKWASESKMLYFMFDLDRGGYDNSQEFVRKCKELDVAAQAIYLPPRIKSDHGFKDLAAARTKFNDSLIHLAVKKAKENVILSSWK